MGSRYVTAAFVFFVWTPRLGNCFTVPPLGVNATALTGKVTNAPRAHSRQKQERDRRLCPKVIEVFAGCLNDA